MDQKQPEQVDVDTEAKTEWTRPEVDRLNAGGAEAGGSTSTDGIDIFS